MVLSEMIPDTVGAAVFALNPQGQVILWNRGAVALTGISADQMHGKSFAETALFPGDIDQWRLEFNGISSDSTPGSFEIRWKKHDGTFVPVRCSRSTVLDSTTSAVQYFVYTVNDSVSRDLWSDRMDEFRDIARFLHNTVSQDLVALSFSLDALQTARAEPALQPDLESALRLIDRCCRDIRVLSSLVTPPLLAGTTLEQLIEAQAAFVHEETGMRISPDLDPVSELLLPDGQLLIFTAVQSWIGRAVLGRTKTDITIRLRSPRGGGVVLEMESDRPPAEPDRGWSLFRERAQAFGGQFWVSADAGRITATMKLPERGAE